MQWNHRIGRRIKLRDLHVLLVTESNPPGAWRVLRSGFPYRSRSCRRRLPDLRKLLGRSPARPDPAGRRANGVWRGAPSACGTAVFDDLRRGVRDLTDRRRLQAGVLAYAEQRALEIGITIAGGAGIILLDEPSAGMSVAEAARAVALIRKVSEGRTLIMIEHDMGVVFDLADRISVLVYGQIIASDIPARIKQDAAVQTAYLGTAA